MIFKFAKSIVQLLSRSAYRDFLLSLDKPDLAQQVLLENLIAETIHTEYGKKFDLQRDDSYEQFRLKLPISDYQSLQDFIEKEKSGLSGSLLRQTIIFFEK